MQVFEKHFDFHESSIKIKKGSVPNETYKRYKTDEDYYRRE
jgi:hypothetical protein